MKTINLKLFLMLLMMIIAITCLLATSFFTLYQSNKQFSIYTNQSATSLEKQLNTQIIKISTVFSHPAHFPDFSLWKESEQKSGLCARFTNSQGKVRKTICRGGVITGHWPEWFEFIYRKAFNPDEGVTKKIQHRNKIYGSITVYPSAETEIAQAWRDVKKLMSLSLITVVALCLLLLFVVGWLLRPAHRITKELNRMSEGELTSRIPNFHITEWQQTGTAINNLAENLQRTLTEREALALKLVNAQEEERRYITQELHDEFGQSLSGLTALASSITQTAKQSCPELVKEGEYIEHVAGQMMEQLRNLLTLLRPVDIDQIGLIKSVQSMVARNKAQSNGKINYTFIVSGDLDHSPDPVQVNIYRIIQECLTNISKHSSASKVLIRLERKDNILLEIEDNGLTDNLTHTDNHGHGLIGIRERVSALGGELTLTTCKPSGLAIHISIPLNDEISS